jgi:hypothetical protein
MLINWARSGGVDGYKVLYVYMDLLLCCFKVDIEDLDRPLLFLVFVET